MVVGSEPEAPAQPTGPKPKVRRLRASQREAIAGYAFLGPWLVGLGVFTLGPVVVSLVLSLTNYNIVNANRTEYVGLSNYTKAVSDPLFFQSLKVTLYYSALAIPLNLVIGFALAYLLNKKLRGMSVFRTLYYMPAVLSGVVVTLLWVWILNPRFGLFNYLLGLVGINGPNWLFSTSWVIPAFVLISLWGVGQTTLIYLAMLQAIPTELYEAAQIDGARPAARLFHITIPMVTPAIFFNLVLGLIANFQFFDTAYVGTGGGPQNASLFYGLYLYQNAFSYFKMGYASALAWILFLITGLLTIIIFKTGAIWVFYQEDKTRR